MNPFLDQLKKLVATLDANQRAIIVAAALEAFDQHVTVPGPDNFIKNKIRPHLRQSIENFLTNQTV